MNKNTIILIILPISIIILGIVLNFPEFLMGSPASIKNLIVTIVFFTVWILILGICFKAMNRKIMLCYSAFWIFTLIIATLTFYIRISEITLPEVIPLITLFLTQWYGTNYFVDSQLTTSIWVSFISLTMFIVTIISSIKWKQV
ncbi:hypothetical protein [Ornithinibacillus sp. FSL M8-0202]|uniref:hypothetical protein n=1 Tax=Ornithinibacillus sp. FSL M8-0202 TaxID=2921616 RepID=UPI0030D4BA2B